MSNISEELAPTYQSFSYQKDNCHFHLTLRINGDRLQSGGFEKPSVIMVSDLKDPDILIKCKDCETIEIQYHDEKVTRLHFCDWNDQVSYRNFDFEKIIQNVKIIDKHQMISLIKKYKLEFKHEAIPVIRKQKI